MTPDGSVDMYIEVEMLRRAVAPPRSRAGAVRTPHRCAGSRRMGYSPADVISCAQCCSRYLSSSCTSDIEAAQHNVHTCLEMMALSVL